jgi:hypothetical protein
MNMFCQEINNIDPKNPVEERIKFLGTVHESRVSRMNNLLCVQNRLLHPAYTTNWQEMPVIKTALYPV